MLSTFGRKITSNISIEFCIQQNYLLSKKSERFSDMQISENTLPIYSFLVSQWRYLQIFSEEEHWIQKTGDPKEGAEGIPQVAERGPKVTAAEQDLDSNQADSQEEETIRLLNYQTCLHVTEISSLGEGTVKLSNFLNVILHRVFCFCFLKYQKGKVVKAQSRAQQRTVHTCMHMFA